MGSKPSKGGEDGGNCGTAANDKTKKKNKRRKVLLLETLDDHEDAVNCMTLSDDGSLLVTGGEDCTARMWSTKTENVECLGVLEGHSSYITCIAIVDTFVITGSADNSLRKWEMTTCDCLFVYTGHTCRIARIICTGQFIFSSSYDKTAMAWLFDAEDLADGNANKALIRVFKGHAKGVYPLVFIPADGIPTEIEVDENQMDINPGDLLITGSADCTARSWSVDTGGCLKTFDGHTMPIMCMSADVTGRTLFTGGGDNTVMTWDIRSGARLREFIGHDSAIIGLQVVNKMLYTISCDQTARSWVAEFGDCTRIYKGHNHSVTCMKYCNGMVFTGCGDGMGRAFDAKSGALKDVFKGHQGSITALAVVDGKFYTSCVDGKLRVFDASHLLDDVRSNPFATTLAAANSNEQLEKNNKKIQELEDKLDGYDEDEPFEKAENEAKELKGKLGEKAENGAKELKGKLENGAKELKGKFGEQAENGAKELKGKFGEQADKLLSKDVVSKQVQKLENHAQKLEDVVSQNIMAI